ncbi:unnamed protein product [Rotaria socialis]|uniref:Uncharacterized protein n=1 Tax=Rotaria socialis TaxID=392032 RepID=A0A818H5E6_9BILA|nr:unnamed protein product [Rotaria socialis]CAF4756162.1 unnamed protein product [Rotaria socialis]
MTSQKQNVQTDGSTLATRDKKRVKFRGSLKFVSSLLLPLTLGVFTVVITFQQQSAAKQQRDNDRNAAKQLRDQEKQDAELLRKQEKDLDKQRYENSRFDAYIQQIGKLLEKYHGSIKSSEVVATLARVKTLNIFRQLEPQRNVQIIRFLYEAKQLTDTPENRSLDLSTAELSDIDFRESSINKKILNNLSLVNVFLSNATFICIKMAHVNFSSTKFYAANFSLAEIHDADFSSAEFYNTSFTSAEIHDADFSFAEFYNTNSTLTSFFDTAFATTTFQNVSFSSTTFDTANFSLAEIHDVDFSFAEFYITSFTSTSFSNTIFATTTFQNVNFSSTTFDTIGFSSARLENANFSSNSIRYINFTFSSLVNVDFSFCVLYNADFSSAWLANVNFSHAVLFNATFPSATLDDVDFSSAELQKPDFSNAQLTNLNFTSTKLIVANFTGAKVFNTNFHQSSCVASIFNHASLSDCDFRHSNLKHAVFYKANLNQVNFSRANLYKTNFTGANMTKSELNNTLSIHDAILPNETSAHDENLIKDGQADCNISHISGWTLSNGNITTAISNKSSSNFQFTLQSLSTGANMYQRVSLSDKWDSNFWTDSEAVLSAKMSTGVSIELKGIKKNNAVSSMETLINIPANATWAQNGVTIAGGNGRGGASNQLYYPEGLFVDDDQTVVIADFGYNRIMQWRSGDTTNGQAVAGGKGKENGLHQLNGPSDVLIDKETDSLIICDRENRRVVRWSRRSGTTQGEILLDNIWCWGLAMDEQRYFYVSDTEKDEVRRYQLGEQNGTLVAGGNGQGDRLNQLNLPTYLFVDRQQTVYVSDSNNLRVMKWDKGANEGIVVAGGQGEGSSLTQLKYPNGIFVDTLGTLYVADFGNHRVMRWTQGDKKQGTVVVGGNDEGAGANQFNYLVGLSFDRHGNLYVVDRDNHRVQRFSIE